MNRLSMQCCVLLLTVVGLSACANLKQMVPKKKKTSAELKEDVKAAEAAKDLEKLKTACKTGMLGEDKLGYSDKKSACAATGRLMEAEMAKVDCKEIKNYFESSKEVSSSIRTQLHGAYGLRAAECDQWTVVFEDLMHWGQVSTSASGYKLLVKIAEAGKPLEAKFVEYLKNTEQPLNIKFSNYAMAHYTMWRAKQNSGEPCSTYAGQAKKLNAGGKYYMLNYFLNKKCAEGMPLALESLASDGANTRILGCRFIAKHGNATHIKKLQILADRDGYNYVSKKNYQRIYPVRNVCGDAIAKIKVRQ